MKRSITIFSIIGCSVFSFSQNTWTVINTGYKLQCLGGNLSVQKNSVYVLNSFGSSLIRSFDRGLTWDSVYVPSDSAVNNYEAIRFLNDSVGFLAGYDGGPFQPTGMRAVVKKTLDRGATWQTISNGLTQNSHLTHINFFDPDTGFVFGTGFGKADRFITGNQGLNWNFVSDQTPPYQLDMGIVKFSSFVGSHGFIGGFSPSQTTPFKFAITHDKGATWLTKKFPAPASPSGLKFFNNLQGLVIVEDSIHFTNDGGQTFSAKKFPYSNVVRAFDMVDMQHGYFCTVNTIYYTADGANTFSVSYQNSNFIVGQVKIEGPDVFVTSCNQKEILKMSHGLPVVDNNQYEFAYHDGIDRSYDAMTLGSRLYYVEFSQKIESCCAHDLNLVKAADGGQILQRKKLGFWPYPERPLIAVSADQHFIVAGGTTMEGCDVDGDDFSVFKVDTSGNVIWEKKLNMIVEQLVTLNDSSIVFYADQKIWKWNLQGVQTQSVVPVVGTVYSICNLHDGGFLVSHVNGGGPQLKEYSKTLQGASDVSIGFPLQSMQQMQDSSLVGLSNGVLRRYNKNHVWITNSDPNVPSSTFTITAFRVSGNKVYCAGYDNNSKLFYYELNSALSPDQGSLSNMPKLKPSAVVILNNRVHVLSTGRSDHSYVSLLQFPKNGQLSSTNDIGVSRATVTSMSISGSFPSFEADVIVKNYGSQPVHNFHVNSYVGSGFLDCLIGLNKGYTLTIAPGDSLTVKTGVFWKDANFNPTFPQTVTLNMCFFSTVPNEKNDKNAANDQSCTTYTFHVTGLTEGVVGKDQVSIFPNPGKDLLTVTSSRPISSIKIIDITGQLLFSNDNAGQPSAELRHRLSPGVYLLQLETGGSLVIRKLIVGE